MSYKQISMYAYSYVYKLKASDFDLEKQTF